MYRLFNDLHDYSKQKNDSQKIRTLDENECVFRCLIEFRLSNISNLLSCQILHRSIDSNCFVRHFEFLFFAKYFIIQNVLTS